MYITTNRAASAQRVDRSAGVSTPLWVQMRRWLTEVWAGREQRRVERLVLEIGHPGAITEMRQARERRDEFAAWN